MEIRIKNFDVFLAALQRGESELKDELNAKYKAAVDRTAAEIARGAVGFLNKPGWELSSAIKAGRLKEYREGRVLFQAVEPVDSKSPKPNTPAAYAWYHEHGYTVQASKVKRPRSGRIIREGNKRAAYRRQEPKWFFKQAADATLPKFRDEIAKINVETKLKLKG